MKKAIVSIAAAFVIFSALALAAPPVYPKFELFAMDGGRYTSLQLRGRAVLLVFFARPCHPCRLEVPFLNDINKKYSDNLTILSIAFLETDYAKLKALVQDWGIKYPVIPDGDGMVARAFENVSFPRSFLMDHTGKIIADYNGLSDVYNRDIVSRLDALGPKIKEYRAKGPAFFIGKFTEKGVPAGQGKLLQGKISSWFAAEKIRIADSAKAADYVISGVISPVADKLKVEFVITNSGGIEELRLSAEFKPGSEDSAKTALFDKLRVIPYTLKR